jgi:arginyl-tRNA synthetase
LTIFVGGFYFLNFVLGHVKNGWDDGMLSLKKKLTKLVAEVFVNQGFDAMYGEVTVSDRPDLSQFQCNGAFALAKSMKQNPLDIAKRIVAQIPKEGVFKEIGIAGAGFINFVLEDAFLKSHLGEMKDSENLGLEKPSKPKKIILDYGGPNVGKPLHVGHLRTAIIGESLKRISRRLGHEVIGDVHLGDWGLQMGMILVELKRLHPDWIYFQDDFSGEYPKKSPITYEDFENTYPIASKRAKEDLAVMEEARRATKDLQEGKHGYMALWRHFIEVSVAALKKSYQRLFVEFDLWRGESDVQEIIPDMVGSLKKEGFAYESDGAFVIDVNEDGDEHVIPPFMLSKSDGSALYSTTDLATILQRKRDFSPDAIWYVVDMRQSLHFKQVFRCSYKTGILSSDTTLCYLGFGTMNGKDGKPYKTRDGGVMQLDALMDMVEQKARERLEIENIGLSYDGEEKKQIANYVGMAALKYADLMNHRTKDYVFDIERFLSFEGRTGAYLLYAMARIKSLQRKAKEQGFAVGKIGMALDEIERALQLKLVAFSDYMESAFLEKAPNLICDYVFQLAQEFNRFYHEHRILTEENIETKQSWLGLLALTHDVMATCLDVLGIKTLDRL